MSTDNVSDLNLSDEFVDTLIQLKKDTKEQFEKQLQASPVPTELGKKTEYNLNYLSENDKWKVDSKPAIRDPYASCPHCGKAKWKRIIGKLMFCKFCHKHA